MTWWAILRSDDDLESVGETVAPDAELAARRWTKLALVGRPDFALVLWDKASRTFVPRLADPVRDRITEMMTDTQMTTLSLAIRDRIQMALVQYFDDVRRQG